MARANQEFFVKLRKEISGDNTPLTTIETMEIELACIPGREPRNSMIDTKVIELQNVCKEKDEYIALLEESLGEAQIHFVEIEEAKVEAIRTLVAEIIAYTEEHPYQTIKEVLYAQIGSGVISHSVLDENLRKRLNNLKGKEPEQQNSKTIILAGDNAQYNEY